MDAGYPPNLVNIARRFTPEGLESCEGGCRLPVKLGVARVPPVRHRTDGGIATSEVRLCSYFLITESWLATHSHLPFAMTHVSVKRPRRSNGFPAAVPLPA